MTTATTEPIAASAIPRTLGVVHILYGLALLGFSLCWGAYLVGIPFFLEVAQQKAAEKAREARAERDRRLAEFDRLIAEANDEDARAALASQKAAMELQRGGEDFVPRFGMLGLANPPAFLTLVTEIVSGDILYLFMVIAGVGLVRLRRWGRSFAVGVAWLKILQVAVVAGLYVGMLGPTVADGVREEIRKAAELDARDLAEAPELEVEPLPPPEEVAGEVRQAVLFYALGGLAFGLVYPVATIVLLTRPSVRAAFAPPKSGGVEE